MQNIINRIKNLKAIARSKIKIAENIMKEENIGCVNYINAEKSKAYYEGMLRGIKYINGEK